MLHGSSNCKQQQQAQQQQQYFLLTTLVLQAVQSVGCVCLSVTCVRTVTFTQLVFAENGSTKKIC